MQERGGKWKAENPICVVFNSLFIRCLLTECLLSLASHTGIEQWVRKVRSQSSGTHVPVARDRQKLVGKPMTKTSSGREGTQEKIKYNSVMGSGWR